MKITYIINILLFLGLFGCGYNSLQHEVSTRIPQETVLLNGTQICAFVDNEQLCVTAENKVKRSISFLGKSYSIDMVPRKERWHGILGLTSPNKPANIFNDNGINTRIIFTEAQIHYNSINKAVQNIPFYRNTGINAVYNDNGILVMWRNSTLSNQRVLDISVYQILINNMKPSTLPSSQNDKIKERFVNISDK